MFGAQKIPFFDKTLYSRSNASRRLSITEHPRRYVYVVDVQATIHVAPDASHAHPTVLGFAQPALYAGEISIDRHSNVDAVTNCSGTFQFDSQQSLCCVAARLQQIGFTVDDVVWYPPAGSSGPKRLRC